MFHAFFFFSWISEVRRVNIQVWITTLYTCFQRFLLDDRQQTSAATRCTLCLGETTSPWTLCHSPSRLILLSRKPPHALTSGRNPQGFNVSAARKLICVSVRRCEPATQEEKKSQEVWRFLSLRNKTFLMFICVQTLGDLVLRVTAPPITHHGLYSDGWASNFPFNYSLSNYFKSLTKHRFY